MNAMVDYVEIVVDFYKAGLNGEDCRLEENQEISSYVANLKRELHEGEIGHLRRVIAALNEACRLGLVDFVGV